MGNRSVGRNTSRFWEKMNSFTIYPDSYLLGLQKIFDFEKRG